MTTETNDRLSITLETPIKRGDSQIEQLVVRKPCGSELRGTSLFGVARMDADAIMTLLPRISEPPSSPPRCCVWTPPTWCR